MNTIQLGLREMESDLPLIEMDEEEDSLIQHLPDLDQTSSRSYSPFSPFPFLSSHAKNLKDGALMEKTSSSTSEVVINNKENINSNSVEVPKLGMEPMQMKRRKKATGYNLRKSLAWDRAFSTDEGILDPSDLSLITGIDANTCGGGLLTITEEENSSLSSDVRCTDESSDIKASEEAPVKVLHDNNHTTKGNREKTSCSMRNHDSLLHRKVTNKVLSSNCTSRGGSKLGGCSEPLAASSLKRPANSNTLKTERKESKLPKLPISKTGPCLYTITKGSMAASQLKHNLIPKPTTKVEKTYGLKSSLKNAHVSQSKAKTGSCNLQLPAKDLAQKTVKKLTHSSKAASSIRSKPIRPVQADRANNRSGLVKETLQVCKVLDESTPLAVKHLAQHAASNSTISLPEATRLTSSGSCNIQRVCEDQMISDRLHPCESQNLPADLAKPSGLRLPSPSLRLFDLRTAPTSGSLQQKKLQQYMDSVRKNVLRSPLKSNDITENICRVVLTPSKECCSPSTQLNPSPNYALNTSFKRVTDSKSKSVLCNKEDEVQNCTAFSMSTFEEPVQHQEENKSTGVNDLGQTSLEETDTEKSDDAFLKVKPVFHLDAGSQVFMESEKQVEIGKSDNNVGTLKYEIHSVVLPDERENDVFKYVDSKILLMDEDDSSCSKTVDMKFKDSNSLEDEADVSASVNSQLSVSCIMPAENSCLEEDKFSDLIDINDHISQEKGGSNVILMELTGEKQDGIDTDLIPREVDCLIDDENQSNNLSHFRPEVENVSETVSLNDDTFVNISKTNVEDEQVQLLNGELLVQSCSSLKSALQPSVKDQVLINDRILSTEKIFENAVVPEKNTNDVDQNLTTMHVNGDDDPQGFVKIVSSVETYDCFTNKQSNLSLSVSQQLTTGVKITNTPESCCLIDGEDESLLTKTTYLIGSEESKMRISEQVDETPIVGEFQLEFNDLKDHKDATMLMKSSNNIKRQQDNNLVINPPNAVPFSDEWLAAFEAAGEEILTMKRGAVQHSPQDKSLPEPNPWSPVKRKANQIGPYDCTKYMNLMPSNSQVSDQ